MKHIDYKFYGKNYKLFLAIGNYYDNGELYIGLVNKDGESFADLTINIPFYFFEQGEDGEIIINGDISQDLVKKLVELNIIKKKNKYAYSGYGKYEVAKINKEVMKDYILIDYNEE